MNTDTQDTQIRSAGAGDGPDGRLASVLIYVRLWFHVPPVIQEEA